MEWVQFYHAFPRCIMTTMSMLTGLIQADVALIDIYGPAHNNDRMIDEPRDWLHTNEDYKGKTKLLTMDHGRGMHPRVPGRIMRGSPLAQVKPGLRYRVRYLSMER